MKTETEAIIVVTLDKLISELDNVLDELDEIEGGRARNAEALLMKVTIGLNNLIDRLTEESCP